MQLFISLPHKPFLSGVTVTPSECVSQIKAFIYLSAEFLAHTINRSRSAFVMNFFHPFRMKHGFPSLLVLKIAEVISPLASEPYYGSVKAHPEINLKSRKSGMYLSFYYVEPQSSNEIIDSFYAKMNDAAEGSTFASSIDIIHG